MKTLGNTGGLGIPKLRGIVHLVMSPLSLVVGIVLITLASELSGRITLGVFTITAVTLFTCSALYHRVGWSKKYKAQILNSRLFGTTTIASAVEKLKPSVFISSSAIGWYGETGNRAVTESDRAGDDFLASVCKEWEAAADAASSVRTVKIRTGLVLDPTGGALGRMMPLFKMGLGGRLGNGKQWWSWITLHDEIKAISYLLEKEIEGPVNLTSPSPVTNSEFTAALARALRRPALFPAPAFALKIALGGFSTEILGSKRVIPQRLVDAGFQFDFPQLPSALTELVK